MSQNLTLKRGGVLRTLAGLRANMAKLELQILNAGGKANPHMIQALVPMRSLLADQDAKLRKQWNFKPSLNPEDNPYDS